MKLKYVEVFQSVFLNNTNLGTKLTLATKGGLKLEYNDKLEFVEVLYKGQKGYIPQGNIVSFTEEDGDSNQVWPKATIVPTGKIKAQVSTPMGVKERE